MNLRNVRRAAPVEAVKNLVSAPLEARPNEEASQRPVDLVLAATVVALIGFGVVMVYSASTVQGTTQHHDAQFFLKRHVYMWFLRTLRLKKPLQPSQLYAP